MEIIEFIIFMIVAVFSIVLHECAHGYVALLNGDPTARLAGRLTLNPLRHFDLTGFLLFAFCRIGYARPVPINPYNFKKRKLGIITVSLSGVTINILLAFFAVPIIMLLRVYLYPAMSTTQEAIRGYQLIEYFFQCFLSLGVSLFLFNLLPIYPLDGYNVLEAIVGCKSKIVRVLRDYGKYAIIVIFILLTVATRLGLPNEFNPVYWYMTVLGGKIKTLFWNIWLPLFV